MNALELGKIESLVYVLLGDEQYLQDVALSKLKLSVGEVNYRVLSVPCELSDLIIDANTMSMFGEKAAIVAEEREKLSKQDKQLLIEYAQNPNPETILVLMSSGAGKVEDYSFLSKLAIVVDCNAPDKNKIFEWIGSVLSQSERKMTHSAIKLLVEKCGNEMSVINNELCKLFNYTNAEISESDVEECVAESAELSVFELSDAMADKNNSKALKILYRLLRNGTEPNALFGLLEKHFRRILHCKLSTLPNDKLAKFLEVGTGAIFNTKKNSDKYSAREAKFICDLIAENEKKFKTGVLSVEQALQNTVAVVIAKNSK